MDGQPLPISLSELYARLGTASASVLVDMRRPVDFPGNDRLIVGASHVLRMMSNAGQETSRRIVRPCSMPTSFFAPEIDRFMLAGRGSAREPAAIWLLRPVP
jgi:hypothetical protein